MHKPVVVIVDRDPTTLEFLSQILHSDGWHVVTAQHPRMAYSLIMERRPELILLDIHLHQRHAGWVLIDLLRAHQHTKDIPIVVCSDDVGFLQQKANRLKVKACLPLTKPVSAEPLLELISQLYPRALALGGRR